MRRCKMYVCTLNLDAIDYGNKQLCALIFSATATYVYWCFGRLLNVYWCFGRLLNVYWYVLVALME